MAERVATVTERVDAVTGPGTTFPGTTFGALR